MTMSEKHENSYKLAIQAREHHYNNFNHWMYFYATIIGVLFVGYYTTSNNWLLNNVIVLLGFATTFAWLQSYRGYYHWINHWIKVVIAHEEQYILSIDNKNERSSLAREERVYSCYYESENENSRCPLHSRNISTQKITLRLIFILLIAWGIMLLYTFVKHSYKILAPCFSKEYRFLFANQCWYRCISFMLYLIVMVTFLVVIIVTFTRHTNSDISNHLTIPKKEEDREEKDIQSPPAP